MANVNCLEGMRCPKCKHADEVLVRVAIWTSLRDDGTDHNADSIGDASVDYDDDSSARCPMCDYFGKLQDWRRPTRKGKKK